MRRCLFVILVAAFLAGTLYSPCLAQDKTLHVASPSQLGSLLMFPKVRTDNGWETYISINNHSNSKVNVKCYWESKITATPTSDCYHSDMEFELTRQQPTMIVASDGSLYNNGDGIEDPGRNTPHGVPGVGIDQEAVLKCWAVDNSGENSISHNYLSGQAILYNASGATFPEVWEYNAWSFRVHGKDRGQVVGTGGTIYLSGGYRPASDVNGYYDACPNYLIFDFFADPEVADSDLALLPCQEDLRQDDIDSKPTKATFTIWNENETKYTGTHQCLRCFLEVSLDDIEIRSGYTQFARKALHTDAGRFRVTGKQSIKCPGSANMSLVGVLAQKFVDNNDFFGTTPTGAGAATQGTMGRILWDPSDPTYRPKR